jgi:hypothetical protein
MLTYFASPMWTLRKETKCSPKQPGSHKNGTTMPIDSVSHIPLIDHHCHGVSPADLDYGPKFQARSRAIARRHLNQRISKAAWACHPFLLRAIARS